MDLDEFISGTLKSIIKAIYTTTRIQDHWSS
jgi:hypothetical protein